MPEEAPHEEHIRTNFLENQARDADKPLFSQAPIKIVLALVGAGVLFGGYQVAMFLINMDHNNAMKNVDIMLNKPDLRDGVAMVDVTISNCNTVPVSKVAFHYSILAPSGSAVAQGDVTIPNTIPAGDQRTFTHVKLGALTDSAARMHTDLVDLKVDGKSGLTADQDMRFNELAASDKDEQKQQGFARFINECPNFLPAYIELARSYIKTDDYKQAVSTLEKAGKIDDKNGDVHYYLGLAYELDGNKKSGAAELQKAYDLLPNDDDLQRTITRYRQ